MDERIEMPDIPELRELPDLPPAERTCLNCLHLMWPERMEGFWDMKGWQVMLPVCINHADSPGELREVHPCWTCRNFRARRGKSERCEPPEPESPDVKYIPLTKRKFAIVDAADYEWLSQYKWCAQGGGRGRFYAARNKDGKTVTMHREIMKPPPGMVVDHINHNPLDNRRSNLRVCTPRQNMYNRRPRRASGLIGVEPHGRKWKAKIECAGERFFIGLFEDQHEAARARDRKAVELFGKYAYLNFPEETDLSSVACDGCQQSRSIEPGTQDAGQKGDEEERPRRKRRRYVSLSGSIVVRSSLTGTLTVVEPAK